MSFSPAFFSHLASQGAALHARVLSRDDAHLRPERVPRAVAARLRAGIAALESWLRRVLILMALSLEPGLKPAAGPWIKTYRPRRLAGHRPGLRIFLRRSAPDPGALAALPDRARVQQHGPVQAAPLLARLAALRALVDAPEARAQRLAFHIARRRPGRLVAPPDRAAFPRRLFGTEAGALHDAMAQAICEHSRARPPPLGPAPCAGPRIRSL